MGEVGHIKLTSDMMNDPRIKLIRKKELGDSIVVLWLNLILKSSSKTIAGAYVFSLCGQILKNDVMGYVFDCDGGFIKYAMNVLEEYGMIIRKDTEIIVDPFWLDVHDRASPEYKTWRLAVFKRDGFRCRGCGSREKLCAHHIIYWRDTKDNRDLRYDVNNGITLCVKCHLEAHGGSWK